MERLIAKAINWVKANRAEAFFLAVVLLIGAFLRLYRIDEYMTFLGDEGRDAIIVRRLLVNFDPILIGPGTSIGNMYLGPLYYYMIAPALFLANFNPAGPSVMISLLGILTIWFIWFVVREWFPKNTSEVSRGRNTTSEVGISIGGLVAAGLYAVSPVVINFSKSSWNPNIMPFFSLLAIYSVWKFWKENKFRWIIITFLSMAFVLQSHYLGLLLAPVIVIFWVLTYLSLRRTPNTEHQTLKRSFLKYSLVGLVVFLILMSPLALFDLRHNFMNFNAVKVFFTQRQTTVSALPWKALPKLPEVMNDSISSLLGAKNLDLTWLFTYGILLFIAWIIFKELSSKRKINSNLSPYFLLLIWLLMAYVGLGLYKQHIYDHYYGFFFAAPFILVGAITQYVFSSFKFYWKAIFVTFFIYAIATNLARSPLKYPPNRQMQRAIDVAEKIKEEAGGQKFNLAVIAERNYEDGYQYFLERWGEPVFDIDALNYEKTLADNLFVVCEMPKEKCDPTHNPKTEVANFGWSKIEGEWEVAGVILYKLVHTQ
ncbi:MAG: hypothetical protein UT23_C0012G0103 [Candidatus Woesebacteria bacterium GW2011_GWA1_39_12]|uniref:Glycosyltransferase RgtA/B/C/D-like domain-containing protein n=2 Tax=Candidatus Woeseibacteriota TaxID=1752722 RepID=A0A0G0LZY5_9BACT|nr:MAG: hypothetical protein UT23_C0012G0103 [Candidatus Woesebacteria bacterium GW2011_GWA1_39_12]